MRAKGDNMEGLPVHILLVDDDEVDVEAVRRGFVALRIGNAITVANDGFEALNILRGEEGYERLPRPYIILLDLNMPRMNGFEFLEELREDSDLKSSIVFVLTTSNREEDMLAAYKERIAGYFVKNNVGEGFLAVPDLLNSYWRIVEFPASS
jgi:CheY-like chemotaxis protein